MIYFNVLGQHFVVLCSSRRTTDLLEKRSSNYSDRPRMPMVMELYASDFFFLVNLSKKLLIIISIGCRMGWDFSLSLIPYGLKWRSYRRAFHGFFHVNTVHKYLPIQRREVHAFLRRLLVTPDNFLHHIRQ